MPGPLLSGATVGILCHKAFNTTPQQQEGRWPTAGAPSKAGSWLLCVYVQRWTCAHVCTTHGHVSTTCTCACVYVLLGLCCECLCVLGGTVHVASQAGRECTLTPVEWRGMGTDSRGGGYAAAALGAAVGECACPGLGAQPGPGKPSLPAGAARRQTPQNGLQVLLVGADLGEVTLEALDLQLLLLRLLLQQPQFPLQGPGWA